MGEITFPEKFQCLFEPRRYKIFYGGRGGAKSWAFARALLVLGLQKPLRVLCAREMQNSLADSVHKVLKDQIDNMGLSGHYDVLQTSIRGTNGTEFSFEGIKSNPTKVKSYEGIDICWVEEADKVSKDSWEVLIPTIRKEGSEIWIGFNPNLESDYTYQRFVINPPRDAFVVKVTYRDNPFFPETLRAEMEECRRHSEDDYLHIWEGNCKVLLEGAVYAEEMRDVIREGRIMPLRYDPVSSVDVFFDLGRRDKTAIWFKQYIAMQHRYIDYYEDSGKHIDEYLKLLQQKGYIYGTVWLPHDARSKTLGTKMSIEEMVRAKGFNVRIVPGLSLVDGINASRTVLVNSWFDSQRCGLGLNCLKSYKYEVDQKTGQRSQKPLHDDSSHGADAFRYSAIASGQPRKDKFGKGKNKFKSISEFFLGEVGGNSGWMGS